MCLPTTEDPFLSVHRCIADFLKTQKRLVIASPSLNKSSLKLFRWLLEHDPKIHKDLAISLKIDEQRLSESKKLLNSRLKELCTQHHLSCDIQIYSHSIMKNWAGYHFSYISGDSKNSNTSGQTSFHEIQLHLKEAECLLAMQDLLGPKNTAPLIPIKELLKTNRTEKACWFRKAGPIAADFQAGHVVTRQYLLDKLHEQIIHCPISLLVGEPGTGKTALLRHWAYHCYNKMPVYHYQFTSSVQHNTDQLIRAIEKTAGLIILEDVHLQVPVVQIICESIGNKPNKRLLLAARPSYINNENSRNYSIDSLPKLLLNKFEKINDLVNAFVSGYPDIKWPANFCAVISEKSGGNLWLIKYALEGCLKHYGDGAFQQWVESGIEDDFRDLANDNTEFPKILVALSPLFKNETETAELFLINELKFSERDLRLLASRGDISKNRSTTGHIYYGLTHSELADIYWKYGREFRIKANLPEYEDFLLRYVTSNTPNSLVAVIRTQNATKRNLIEKLHLSKLISKCIDSETDHYPLPNFIRNYASQYSLQAETIESLARKLNQQEDLSLIGVLLYDIFGKEPPKAYHIIDILDWNMIKDQLNIADPMDISSFITNLILFDRDMALRACNLINWEKLPNRLNNMSVPYGACYLVNLLFRLVPEKALWLWHDIDRMAIASKLMNSQGIYWAIEGIIAILQINEQLGFHFLHQIGERILSQKFMEEEKHLIFGWVMPLLKMASPLATMKICDYLSGKVLAEKWNSNNDIKMDYINRSMKLLAQMNCLALRELLEHLDISIIQRANPTIRDLHWLEIFVNMAKPANSQSWIEYISAIKNK